VIPRSLRRKGAALGLVTALASLAGPAAAEDIFGSVLAANGTPVAFSEIRACRESDPDACESTVTDGRGRYTIMGLSEGRYTVSVTGRSGARQVELRGNLRLDITAE
jgi:hypothetical protein